MYYVFLSPTRCTLQNSSEEPIPPKLGPKPFVPSSGRNMNNGSTLTTPSPETTHAHDNTIMSEEKKTIPATKPPAPLPENPMRLPVAEFGHHVQRYHSNNNQPFHTEFEASKHLHTVTIVNHKELIICSH